VNGTGAGVGAKVGTSGGEVGGSGTGRTGGVRAGQQAQTDTDEKISSSKPARRTYSPSVTLPDNLRQVQINASVTVSVTVEANGSHTERIARSSGNGEVDQVVLSALRSWRWEPAVRNGQKTTTTETVTVNLKQD
jgi:protein TonB